MWRVLNLSERIPVQLFDVRLSFVEHHLPRIVNDICRHKGQCLVKNVKYHVVNVVIFVCVELVRKEEDVKPFLDEPFERMEVIMEVHQHEFSQMIWIREQLSLVRSHIFLGRIEKTEYDSTERDVFLFFFVLFFELIPANPTWSVASQADMNEHPEKRFEIVNCIVEHARVTMEVSLAFKYFATSVWGSALNVRLYQQGCAV